MQISNFEERRKANAIKYSNLKLLNQILRIQVSKRTIKNIKSILQVLQDLKFFNKPTQENIKWVCKEIVLRKFPQGQVISYKDMQKLYIILDGLVGIYVKYGQTSKQVVKLNDCDSFGKLCQLQDVLGQYSALNLSDSIIAVLNNDAFQRFEKYTMVKNKQNQKFLKECWIFQNLQDQQINTLSSIANFIQLSSRSVVIKQGELPKALFIVRSGIINMIRTIGLDISQKQMPNLLYTQNPLELSSFKNPKRFSNISMGQISTGQAFPISQLFRNVPCSYTAFNSSPCQIIVISYAQIKIVLGSQKLEQIRRKVNSGISDDELKLRLAHDIAWKQFKRKLIYENSYYNFRNLNKKNLNKAKPINLEVKFYEDKANDADKNKIQ